MHSLDIQSGSKVLILTGAGASAESGIPTFRDAQGLWESHRFEEVASPEGFEHEPSLVWRFYSERRTGVLQAQPNAGHHAIAKLEKALRDRFLLVTQNVDGLHQRAGSERVIEIHGNILKTRCSQCDRAPFDDSEVYLDRLPTCSECLARGHQALLRPHIVWFGEALDAAQVARIYQFMEQAGPDLIFVAIGTSGSVFPAAQLVHNAKALGARTVLVNRDQAENATQFDQVIRGKSGEILPSLLGQDAG